MPNGNGMAYRYDMIESWNNSVSETFCFCQHPWLIGSGLCWFHAVWSSDANALLDQIDYWRPRHRVYIHISRLGNWWSSWLCSNVNSLSKRIAYHSCSLESFVVGGGGAWCCRPMLFEKLKFIISVFQKAHWCHCLLVHVLFGCGLPSCTCCNKNSHPFCRCISSFNCHQGIHCCYSQPAYCNHKWQIIIIIITIYKLCL